MEVLTITVRIILAVIASGLVLVELLTGAL